jgi:hypothetical protein
MTILNPSKLARTKINKQVILANNLKCERIPVRKDSSKETMPPLDNGDKKTVITLMMMIALIMKNIYNIMPKLRRQKSYNFLSPQLLHVNTKQNM